MTNKTYKRPEGLYSEYPRKGGSAPTATHYCPGCGHGVLHKLIGEAMTDLGIQDRTVMISPVGCAVFAYYYFDCGNVQAAHGRAPAVATGISRARDNAVVVSYQGDGDLASIGLNETLQAANRGEKLAVFFVNNTVYGMTGGQMAPTTLQGQKTITTLEGRDETVSGQPLHMCEMVNTLDSPVFIERVSLADIKRVRKARQIIRKALEIQRDQKGYAFVEILAGCPTNLKMDLVQTEKFMIDEMEKEFPLGNFRDKIADASEIIRADSVYEKSAIDDMFGLNMVAQLDSKVDLDFKEVSLKIAGFGGQGVLSLGLIFALVACKAQRFVSWYPSYGPEQRGGTSNCSVILSGSPIGSPVVDQMDVLIAMNRPSLEKFVMDIKPGGTVVYDSSIGDCPVIEGVNCIPVPAVELAKQAGSEKVINTVMLGVIKASGVTGLGEGTFANAIEAYFQGKQKVIDINKKALLLGLEWGRENL